MILRRITASLRARDWLAFSIEFAIVVAGVFIGIQMANWNGERLDRIEAGKVLDRLEQEFQMHLERTDRSLERHRVALESAARLIHGVRDKRFEEATLNDDIDLVTGFATPPGPSTTFQELISSGRLKLLAGAELRSALLGYNDYISMVRSHYGVFTQPLMDARTSLLRARSLLVTGQPSEEITESWATGSVDQDMLMNDPDLMVALQMAYGTQDNIHAVLLANRKQILEILERIAAEKDRVR